jgi:hypothetical protein
LVEDNNNKYVIEVEEDYGFKKLHYYDYDYAEFAKYVIKMNMANKNIVKNKNYLKFF